MKKDFNKDAMYQKIMPSSARNEAEEDAGETPGWPELLSSYVEEGGRLPVNIMELVVREKVPRALKMLGACDCARCCQDSIAIALNQLPPAYTVADQVGVEEKLRMVRGRYEVKITAAVIQAVQAVRENPRHIEKG